MSVPTCVLLSLFGAALLHLAFVAGVRRGARAVVGVEEAALAEEFALALAPAFVEEFLSSSDWDNYADLANSIHGAASSLAERFRKERSGR